MVLNLPWPRLMAILGRGGSGEYDITEIRTARRRVSMLAAVDHRAEIIDDVSLAVGDLAQGNKENSSTARPGSRVV